MDNFSFCSTLKSCIARDFEGGLAVHKMCTLDWPWPPGCIHTGRGLIQYFPFKFQCRAPGGLRLMKPVCQDWDLISSGLLQWSRPLIIFFSPLNVTDIIYWCCPIWTVSPSAPPPAWVRSCGGWCNAMIILFWFLFYLVIYQLPRPPAPASRYLVLVSSHPHVWVTRFTVKLLSSVI